jgi:hypothetical protein
MFHPDDTTLLERQRFMQGEFVPDIPIKVVAEAWNWTNWKAVRDGHTAGVVLGLLYGLERGGWTLPRDPRGSPRLVSLTLAYRCAAAWGRNHRKVRGVRRRTDPISAHVSESDAENCFNRYRSVAHLWGAVFLHEDGYMGSRGFHYRKLVSTVEGLEVLLRTARSVEAFALPWCDPVHGKHRELLSLSPWRLPEGPTLEPDWPKGRLVPWMRSAVKKTRRGRPKVDRSPE